MALSTPARSLSSAARPDPRQTDEMLEPGTRPPGSGRVYATERRVRLSDMDADGRVRLDAVARFLQDAAIDDVEETGWGIPEHLWVIRKIRVDVVAPLLRDRSVAIATWCSGVAAIAAGRRWSVRGDAGGHVEIDSVWIHLGPDQRPARIGDFGPYGLAAAGRAVSTRLTLPDPPADSGRVPWALRSTDLDANGHVNNAVYWQVLEEDLAGELLPGGLDAEIEHRAPADAGEAQLARADGARWVLGADGAVLASFVMAPRPPRAPA